MGLAADAGDIDAPGEQAAAEFLAEHIGADGRDEVDGAAVAGEVVGDVEGRAAGIEGIREEVPEDFTEADNERLRVGSGAHGWTMGEDGRRQKNENRVK